VPAHPEAPSSSLIRDAIDLKRFPWIRPLVAAYSSDFSSVASLFTGNPADPAAWTQTIARVQQSPRDRAGLAKVLSAQLERRGAPHVWPTRRRSRLSPASRPACSAGRCTRC
jgi:hypothetical protein